MKSIRLAVVIAGMLVAAPFVSAQAPSNREAMPRILRPATPPEPGLVNPSARVLAGTRSDAFTIIQGNALTSTNGMLTDGTVRLRDARFGRTVDITTTDKAGLFVFPRVSPGTYVVELVGPDGSVLAASQMLDANAGETVSAIVKLPFRIPLVGAAGGTNTSTAALITGAAASAGVLATRIAGTDVSPRR